MISLKEFRKRLTDLRLQEQRQKRELKHTRQTISSLKRKKIREEEEAFKFLDAHLPSGWERGQHGNSDRIYIRNYSVIKFDRKENLWYIYFSDDRPSHLFTKVKDYRDVPEAVALMDLPYKERRERGNVFYNEDKGYWEIVF